MRASFPNALSVLRIVTSFIIVGVYSGESYDRYLAGIALIVLAIVTDMLDGYLARRWEVTSELGYILDGLGDRAACVALVLTFVAHNGVSLTIAWLLIFREIAIYALRLLNQNWYASNSLVRRFSRWHAAGIRAWFLTYILRDGFALGYGVGLHNYTGLRLAQNALALGTIGVSYYALFKMLTGLAAPLDGSRARGGGPIEETMESEARV